VDGNKRVTPDMWLEYRARHKFQGLHCLCPLLRTTNEEPPFTEAKILLKAQGITSGNTSQNARMDVANILVS
jgi:hypothetical protein